MQAGVFISRVSNEQVKLRRTLRTLAAIGSALGLALLIGCEGAMNSNNSPAPKRDINAVLADHDRQLLAMPGVVGVYVGLMPDGKTPCLRVMLKGGDPALERAIPRSIEGYPVLTEVTGEIRPLEKP